MEAYSIVIILLAIAIGLSSVAKRTNFPYPVLLLLAGIGVGFIPSFDVITIRPDVVFLLFLPPFLYEAAYHISFREFKKNISTISLLAFILVFATTVAIAVCAHYFIGLDWALSFVLGAILSPPDAIAATGVTKGLSLPHRTNTVLEGESLINDASALVAFRFAVAAVAGTAFSPLQASGLFIVSLAGGGLLGLLLARIFVWLAKHLADYEVIVSLNLLLPFLAYLLAEEFYVSGVIAVVTLGLTISRYKARLPEKSIAQSKSVLQTVVFILNGLVFILIGLEFPQILKSIPKNEFVSLIVCAFLIFIVALIIRMMVIFYHKAMMKKRFDVANNRLKNFNKEQLKFPNHRHLRYTLRLEEYRSQLFDTKEAFIIGWSGMRGIVSLAAALSLPLINDGSIFPHRNKIIFLTVVVVIIMLVVQGLGLPLLVKWFKFEKHKHVL